MTKTRALVPTVLILFAACSSTDGGDRGPASTGRRVPLHSGEDRDERRDRRGGREDDDNDRSGCDMDDLNRVAVGDGFSAGDVLTRIKEHGTFSGSYQQVMTQNKYGQYVKSYKLFLDKDRKVLGRWFQGGAPGTRGSDIYEAARDSQPFTHAIDFVNGNRTTSIMQNQYELGHRMAAILATMFAAAERSADCVRYIRKFAENLLPDSDLALLDQISHREMASRVADGSLPEVFGKVAGRRVKIREEISDADKDLATKERQNERALKRLNSQLGSTFRELQRSLMDIGPCRDQVQIFGGRGLAAASKPADHVDTMIESCQEHLEARLDEFKNDQMASESDLELAQSRKEENEKKLEDAIAKGDSKAIRRYEKAIEAQDMKIVSLEKKLTKLAERTKLYSDSLDLLVNEQASSISLRREKIEDLISQQESRASPEFFQDDMQRIQRLRNDLKATSTDYLGLGFFGGFRTGTGGREELRRPSGR